MCCEGLHDVRAKLDCPGQIRFVTVCAVCEREQREIGRQPYEPDPRIADLALTSRRQRRAPERRKPARRGAPRWAMLGSEPRPAG